MQKTCQERARSILVYTFATIMALMQLSVWGQERTKEIVVHMADNQTYSPSVNVLGSTLQHFHYGNGFWDQEEQIIGNGMETDTKYGDVNEVDGVADGWYFLNPEDISDKELQKDLIVVGDDYGYYQMIKCASDVPVYFACKSYYVNDENSPWAIRYRSTAKLTRDTRYRISVACKAKNGAQGTVSLWLKGPTGLMEHSSVWDVEQDWSRYEWLYEHHDDIDRQVVVKIEPARGSSGYEFCIDEAELLPSANGSVHGCEDQDILGHIETFGLNGVPMLRFPGGTTSQAYVWTDGIGPMLKRPLDYFRMNAAYNDGLHPVYVSEAIPGTDEFLLFCEDKGITPLLVVNHLLMVYGGILEDLGCRPEEGPWNHDTVVDLAANWVEYCNSVADGDLSNPRGGIDWAEIRAANGHSTPYNVQFWQVGNEEWYFVEPEAPFSITASDYADHFVDIARAMKEVDDEIRIAATGYHPYFQWNQEVLARAALQRLGDGGPFLMDFLAYHRYSPQDVPPSGWTEEECLTVMAVVLNVRDELRQVQESIDCYTDINTGLSIALTEHATAIWGEDPPGWMTATLGAGMYSAGVWFSLLQGNGFEVGLANYHAFVGGAFVLDDLVSSLIVSDRYPYRSIPYFIGSLMLERFQRATNPVSQTIDCSVDEQFGVYDAEGFGGIDPICGVPYVEAVAVRADEYTATLFVMNRNLDQGYDSVLVKGHFGHAQPPIGTRFDSWVVASHQDPNDPDWDGYADYVFDSGTDYISLHQDGFSRAASFYIDIPRCSLLAIDIEFVAPGSQLTWGFPERASHAYYDKLGRALVVRLHETNWEPDEVRIFDLLGRRIIPPISVYKHAISGQDGLFEMRIPIKAASGTYFLRIQSEIGQSRSLPFVILK